MTSVYSGNVALWHIQKHLGPPEIHVFRQELNWPISGVYAPYLDRLVEYGNSIGLKGKWNSFYLAHEDEVTLAKFVSMARRSFPFCPLIEERDVFDGVPVECNALNSKLCLVQFHYEMITWRRAHFLISTYGETINFLSYCGEKDEQYIGCVMPRSSRMLDDFLDRLACRGAVVSIDNICAAGPAATIITRGEMFNLRFFPDKNPLHLAMARPTKKRGHAPWSAEAEIPIADWNKVRQQLIELEISWEGSEPIV